MKGIYRDNRLDLAIMPVFPRQAMKSVALRRSSILKLSTMVAASAVCLWQSFAPFGQIASAYGSKTRPLDEDAVKLVEKLSHHPELMNLNYLRYNLGYPVKTQVGLSSKIYYWHSLQAGVDKIPHSELTQILDQKGRVTNATFRMDLPESDIKLTDIYKKEMGEAQQVGNQNNNQNGANGQQPSQFSNQAQSGGQSYISGSGPGQVPPDAWASAGGQRLCKQFYDQNCHPALQFSFVKNTTVTYKQEQNRFYVNEVEVHYAGPPLPAPLPEQMQANVDERRTKALAQSAAGSHQLAMPLLKEHLQEQPNDAEAHYALALAFQKQSHLNEAILEYHAAMACAGSNNSEVTQKCTTALQELHVLPAPDERLGFHELKLKAHGQGFREGDEQTSTTRNALIASQSVPPGSANNPNLVDPILLSPSLSSPAGYGNSGNNFVPPPPRASYTSPYATSAPPAAPFVNGQQFGSPPSFGGASASVPASSYFSPPVGLRRPASFAAAPSAPPAAYTSPYRSKAGQPSSAASTTIPGLEPVDPAYMQQQPGSQFDPGF